MANKSIYSLYMILLVTVVAAVVPEAFYAPMDEDSKYSLHWSIDEQAETMRFTVEVKTTGWIGLGISPYTSQMPGSDIVIGWVDSNGKVHLQDRYAAGRRLPTLDSQQDYKLISGSEKDGVTKLTFSRKFVTNDKNDLPLEGGTTRLIWSYNDQDPTSPTDIPIHTKMGSRSVDLFDHMPESEKPKMPADTKSYDFLLPNVTLPNIDTFYWCLGLRLPPVTEKHHVIKIDPVISKDSLGIAHHMILFECESDVKWHGYGADCYGKNMPQHLANCRNGSIIGGWALGGESITYPAEAGFAIGGKNDPKFALVEIHFDNPDLKDDIVDNSGFRIHYTKQLRKNDVGVLLTGHLLSPFMITPNDQPIWNITGYCPSECTSRGLPSPGINLFGIYFHSHLAGLALKARHFRNGKELSIIGENKHFDFDYQKLYYLKKEVKVLPGDIVSVTCYHQTKNRRTFTVGGFKALDEMCLNYFFYYPKADLTYCATQPSDRVMKPYLAKLMKKGIMPVPSTGNRSYGLYDSLTSTTLRDPALIKELYEVETYKPPVYYCVGRNQSSYFDSLTYEMKDFKAAASFNSENTNGAATITSSVTFIMILVCFISSFCMMI